MYNDSLLPDMPSTELDALNQLIRRTARYARRQVDDLQPDEIMALPEVQALMAFITDRVKDAFHAPSIFLTQPVWAEYANEDTWSLDEAASLAAGVDPFYYTILQVYPQSSIKCRSTICEQLDKEEALSTDGAVIPSEFCKWALEADLVETSVVNFFKDIVSLRPERTYQCCGDVTSPSANPYHSVLT